MFSVLRTRLRVSPTAVIATLALVFAMTGGAYAAKKYLITSTKQISPSVLKALRGKAGAGGAAGAAGVQGPAGPAGPQGSAGNNGSNGEKGAQGIQGQTGKDGKQGATGATGVSGFTATLPTGQTETGTWDVSAQSPNGGFYTTAISFPIPLKEAGVNKAFAFNLEQTEEKEFGSSGCTGSVAKPTAPKGVLCVYTGLEVLENAHMQFPTVRLPNSNGEAGYGTSGAVLWGIEPEGGGPAIAEVQGTWAVTAP
jgi:hypothetical protein